MASLLTGVCPRCLYAHRRVTAPYVTKCYSFGILAPWAADCNCGREFHSSLHLVPCKASAKPTECALKDYSNKTENPRVRLRLRCNG